MSVLPVIAIGEGSLCLYLDPQAFSSYLLPLSSWGGVAREKFIADLSAGQGQPTTL